MLITIFNQLVHIVVVLLIIGVPTLAVSEITHRIKLALEKRK